MRTERKTAYRPNLESIEPRIVAAGGVVSAAATHHAPAPPQHHHPAHVAPHHASHPAKHPSTAPAPTPAAPASTRQAAPPPPSQTSLPRDTTTAQAWVELVNMTGQPLEYQIKLGPYADGQFIPFDISGYGTQYRMSSLISDGQRVKADFAVQFGNGPITPLMTGISQASAQGYYIFLDGNFQPYVEPFIRS